MMLHIANRRRPVYRALCASPVASARGGFHKPVPWEREHDG